ncbi:MAG: hypothetical protein FWE08_06105 [Oscillospiraceae bacterium]|nr:hypothetical protein [Oscillospiraceae bacterium]
MAGLPEFCDSTQIAQLFGLTTRRIQQLTQDGVLETNHHEGKAGRYATEKTVRAYIKFLSDKAHGREQKDGLAELIELKLRADVRYKELQGELHQMKKDVAEGRYLLVEEVQLDLGKFFVVFKKFAQAIPGRVAGQLAGHLDSVAARAVERELADEVAGMLAAFVAAGQSAADLGAGSPVGGSVAGSGAGSAAESVAGQSVAERATDRKPVGNKSKGGKSGAGTSRVRKKPAAKVQDGKDGTEPIEGEKPGVGKARAKKKPAVPLPENHDGAGRKEKEHDTNTGTAKRNSGEV